MNKSSSRREAGRSLVQATADLLRERIFASEPGTQIGSLAELARDAGVGIVTIQQVARVLEHEGLLEVRRGPGGGYYGRRPDAAVLERSLAAFMRTHPASWAEALDMTSLLFNELCAAAAGCTEAERCEELRMFSARVPEVSDLAGFAALEEAFQDILFRMVDRPLFELLTRVTLRYSVSRPSDTPMRGMMRLDQWREGRMRIIAAILGGDSALARFEADRSNRQILLAAMKASAECA